LHPQRGYVVRREREDEEVVWVSTHFDLIRMMAAMVRAWTPEMREWLVDRTTEIMAQRALRQREAARCPVVRLHLTRSPASGVMPGTGRANIRRCRRKRSLP
jgi:hypothetical protein